MKQEFVATGPTMRSTELTEMKHGFRVWRVTTSQWMLSSSRSTALVKSTPVHGTLLKVDVIWVPRKCHVEKREWSLNSSEAGK